MGPKEAHVKTLLLSWGDKITVKFFISFLGRNNQINQSPCHIVDSYGICATKLSPSLAKLMDSLHSST